MKALRTVRLFLHYVRFNLRANAEYRTSFAVQVFGMILNNSAFILFWLLLFDHLGTPIRGYGFQDVMFLWALAAFGYGMAAVFLGNSSMLSRIIYRGELDVYLLQPKPLLPNILASRMVASGWGDMSYGLALFLLSQQLSVGQIGLFLLFSILACLVFTSLRVIYHSFTFFLGNAEDFAGLASELTLTFSLYPGSIFQGASKILLATAVPAMVVAYVPAELFKAFDPARLALILAADLGFMALAVVLFRLGLRAYESGNRMGSRL
jgi:ABC-2 type transport system permease protein